jgi:hypothetical protein
MHASRDHDQPIPREWIQAAPTAIHLASDALPFVDTGDGNLLRVL